MLFIVFFFIINIFIILKYFGNINITFFHILLIFVLIFIFQKNYFFSLSSGKNFYVFNISFIFLFSYFNLIFIFTVKIVCLLLLSYILFYFSWFYYLFWFILLFFVFFTSIIVYILSLNYILLFLSWELMGLCWFFLIFSFYFRIKARYASFIALFWNLWGDIFLLIFIILSLITLFWFCFNLNYILLKIIIFLLISICAKWAIYPFYLWLYYAMEGPTPVSAFLHAAWMITAGVFLFFSFPFFKKSILTLLALLWIVFFWINALYFYDLKKIIASSTGSQMGYIFLFFSFNFICNGLILFSSHAIFKSFLFFLAGFIISFSFDSQSIKILKLSFLNIFFLLFCLTSLIGLFFFWCGIFKELWVFLYAFEILIKYFFYIIFLFSFFYSIKFYFIKFNYFSYSVNYIIYFLSLLLFFFFYFLSFLWISYWIYVFNLFFVYVILVLAYSFFFFFLNFHFEFEILSVFFFNFLFRINAYMKTIFNQFYIFHSFFTKFFL